MIRRSTCGIQVVESAADKDDQQTLALESAPIAVFERSPSSASSNSNAPEPPPGSFDERAYLEAFPDVARAIASGEYESALQHFEDHGQRENRLSDHRYRDAIFGNSRGFPPANIDLLLCAGGTRFVSGWVLDDDNTPLRDVTLLDSASKPCTTTEIARCRRTDAEATGKVAVGRHVGFWTLLDARNVATRPEQQLRLGTRNAGHTFVMAEKPVTEEQLRDTTLDYFGSATYCGDQQVESFIQLDTGIGATLIALNAQLSTRWARGAWHLRFGRQYGRFDGSIIVCLYGRPEYLMLQAALFSACPGIERYELIYVSNSPELSERLMRDATIAGKIYDLAITLVVLPGNVGFGIANNLAVSYARSDRILIVNPDVFPKDPDWPERHRHLLQAQPKDRTRFFGVPLYYDNGSLMHAGMYFELDPGLAIHGDGVLHRELIRVEHYGKGAPPQTATLLASRPVPAVTGAFMSVERAWFERLDGFSPDYIYGHYEDADLCLRSRQAGAPVWLHNLPFWHFEGQGSILRARHLAGSIVNRWRFTRGWSDVLHAGLLGPAPSALETT